MIDRRYHNYLLLERSLSKKTIEAYESDLEQLLLFLQQRGVVPEKATLDDLQEFDRASFIDALFSEGE